MRVRELEAHLKMSKRELRRARKTAKTYEAMTALGKGLDTTGAHTGIRSEAATVSANVVSVAHCQ